MFLPSASVINKQFSVGENDSYWMFYVCSQSIKIYLYQIIITKAYEKSQELLYSEIQLQNSITCSSRRIELIEAFVLKKATLGSNSNELFQLNPKEFV